MRDAGAAAETSAEGKVYGDRRHGRQMVSSVALGDEARFGGADRRRDRSGLVPSNLSWQGTPFAGGA
ncbi:pollen-specific leucine-rich repeat extensin-like protein 4 [Iris pallida]|uniref:Pollen-specific leucine-rich repeat extensin-like protein 4 n=1 Tax=Iris pallida TaxID=29817 RepID=A0AAX6EDN5_IRIPA|nr:pollen-specific leucine-rich repeat extensin-like protein 4 [Iris pallida]